MEALTTLLERIAVALEESNRRQEKWIALNTAWHAERMATEQRIVAIHEDNAAKDQAYRERMEAAAEEALGLSRKHIVAHALLEVE